MNVKDLFFPPRCPFCGKVKKEKGPCENCLSSAEELTGVVCHTCGAHPEYCCCGRMPNQFERNVSCYYYKGAARQLLLRFKLRNCPQLAPFIAHRMAQHIRGRYAAHFSAICFVPNSPLNSFKRGYLPTRLLAEELADELHFPLVYALERVHFQQQKYLNGAERRANAQKSYRSRKNVALSGSVLLIDDLITTGATLNACAELLKKAGAERVYTATFAITQKRVEFSHYFHYNENTKYNHSEEY